MDKGIHTKVGQDVVCYCTRCRMDLNHRVVAQVEGLAKRAICQTCRSEHQYRSRKETMTAKGKVKTPSKPRKVVVDSKPSPNIWGELKRRFEPESALDFQMSQKFKRNDCLTHPTFGIGFVQSSQPRTIEVLFELGVKTLAHNR